MVEVQRLVLQEVLAVPGDPVDPQHPGHLGCRILPWLQGGHYHRLVLSFLVVLVKLAVRGGQEGRQAPYPLVPLDFLAVQEFLRVLKHRVVPLGCQEVQEVPVALVVLEDRVFPLVHPVPEVQGDRQGHQALGVRVAGEQEVVEEEVVCSMRGNYSNQDNIQDSSNPDSRYHMYSLRV